MEQELCSGPFGLIDHTSGRIWLNVESEQTAHLIRTTFVSKLSLIVYDISTFINWRGINSGNCLQWKVPNQRWSHILAGIAHVQVPRYSVRAIPVRDKYVAFNQPTYSRDTNSPTSLINEPTVSVLDQSRVIDLQNQIILFKKTIETAAYKDFDAITAIFLVEIETGAITRELAAAGITTQ
jgi:hypothetical protein